MFRLKAIEYRFSKVSYDMNLNSQPDTYNLNARISIRGNRNGEREMILADRFTRREVNGYRTVYNPKACGSCNSNLPTETEESLSEGNEARSWEL